MKILLKKVYYCGFCNKHSLKSLSRHEKVCTKNIDRICKLCEIGDNDNNIKELVIKYKDCPDLQRNGQLDNKQTIEDLKKDTGNCPNCILTIQRLCNFYIFSWNYRDELKKWWKEYNESSREITY